MNLFLKVKILNPKIDFYETVDPLPKHPENLSDAIIPPKVLNKKRILEIIIPHIATLSDMFST